MNYLIKYRNGKESIVSEQDYKGELRSFNLIEDIRAVGEV